MKKENNQNDEWLNSLEDIQYYLELIGNRYSDKEDYSLLISETLLRIPLEKRAEVIVNSIFISDEDYGCVFNLYIKNPKRNKKVKQPIILLNFAAMEKESRPFKMDVIAHEIAHFIKGHHNKHPNNNDEYIKQEKEADDLIEKWGFNRTNKEKYKDLL